MNSTPFDQFVNFIVQLIPVFSIWWLIKLLYLAVLGLYIAFAVIVVRQLKLMSETVKASLNALLSVIAVAHLLVAILVFLLALVIL